MQTESFFNRLLNNLSFPFKDPQWVKKTAIGAGLSLGAFIVPIVPMLFVYGYCMKIMRRIITEDGQASLPEWDDWGKLLSDGFKFWGASLIFGLPVLIVMLMVFGFFFAAMFSPAFFIRSDGSVPPQFGLLFPIAMIAFSLVMMLVALISWAISLVQGAALSHLAAKDSFEAAFRFGEWWPIFKKGFVPFLLAVITVMVLIWVLSFVMQFLLFTIILIVVLPFLFAILMFFTAVYQNAYYALAYREALSKMDAVVLGEVSAA